MVVVRTKDVMKIFHCSEGTAKRIIKAVRLALGKATNNGKGAKGGDPITYEQIIEHFKLK